MAASSVPDITSTLPQVQNLLAPYIKTRQEVSRVRKTLTVFLNSHITHSAEHDIDAHNSSSLLSCECTESLQVPIVCSGLRLAYLRALQAKRKALKAYRALTEEASTKGDFGEVNFGSDRDTREPTDSLRAYLDLLRQRRRYEKLRILWDCLDTLSKEDPAKPKYLDIGKILDEVPTALQFPAESFSRNDHNDPSFKGSLVIDRLFQLKKAVVQAQHSMDHEQGRLISLKADLALSNGGVGGNSLTKTNLSALASVRAELIDWIEVELAATGSSDEAAVTTISTYEGRSFDHQHTKHLHDVKERYQQYLRTRTALLSALSTATKIASLPAESSHSVTDSSDKVREQPDFNQHLVAPLLLCYLSEHFLPMSRFQKSLFQQRTSITTSLTLKQTSVSQAINRLKEESQLLPAYPVLVNDLRFRNATSALATKSCKRTLALADRLVEGHSDVLLLSARAWAFAADASRSTSQQVVKENLSTGKQSIKNATSLLKELQIILGMPQERQVKSAEQEIDAGMRASKSLTKSRNNRAHQERNTKLLPHGRDITVGPWARLNGMVGGLGTGP